MNGSPSITSTGTLSYTPAANASGTAVISFKLTDNGGTANGGVDESGILTFNITVNPSNDAPTFDLQTATSIAENSGAQTVADWATNISAGPADENSQTLSFTISSNDNTALFTVAPAIDASGKLTYTPAAGKFGVANIGVTLSDNGGTANGGVDTSVEKFFTITITHQNAAPVISQNITSTLAEGGTDTISSGELAVTDADNTAAQVVYNVTQGPANGSLQLTTSLGTPVSTFTQDDINNNRLVFVHDSSESTTDKFTFTVTDGTDTVAATEFNFTITAVNDVPTSSKNVALDASNGTTTKLDNASLEYSDPDNTTTQLVYTVTDVPVNGDLELSSTPNVAITTFTQAQLDSGLIVYRHDGTATTTDSFQFTLTDGAGGDISTTTFNINIAVLNTPPTVDLQLGATVVERQSVIIDNTMLSSSDAEQTTASQLTYTLTAALSQGRLEITTNAGVSINSFTQEDINLGRLRYVHEGDTTPNNFVTMTFKVSDGVGGETAETGFDIEVTPVNSDPVLALNLGTNVTEDNTVIITNAVLKLTDVDDIATDLVYTVTNQPTNGEIQLDGVMAFEFTQDDVDNNRITYKYNDDTSTNGIGNQNPSSSVPDTFTFTFRDATLVESAEQTFNITIDPVNDAPTLPVTFPTNETTAMDAAIEFMAANGNEISFEDVDVGTGIMQVSIGVTHGTLTLGGTTGLTFTTGDGTDDASLDFTGTMADLIAALASVTFTPEAGYTGTGNDAAVLTFIVRDQGNSGSGGTKEATGTITIDIM